MKAKILWSERARCDLLEIGDFIARDRPQAAAAWVGKILDSAQRTALFPSSGRVVPEIDRSDIREVILDNYRFVYQLHGCHVHNGCHVYHCTIVASHAMPKVALIRRPVARV
jgi:plasmid stabilization system protein ParE